MRGTGGSSKGIPSGESLALRNNILVLWRNYYSASKICRFKISEEFPDQLICRQQLN